MLMPFRRDGGANDDDPVNAFRIRFSDLQGVYKLSSSSPRPETI